MSRRTISEVLLRDAVALHEDDALGDAVRAVLAAGLPALPVVDAEGRVTGIFGEREFIRAAMPGYVGTLGYAAFVPASLDEALEERESCLRDRVGDWMTTEHVELEQGFSDTQVAETFLGHHVLLLPVVGADRRPRGVILRSDFFRALARRLGC
ncbi:MAG TPA: CBS domain-containing protein [Solirubrobacteraceae bacterium]|nr:CBS domain-containing protein [Solirubrobacteraceae bacterium]